MVGGFNTNVRYRGRVLHVQTEDSGPQHPHIITLLYEAGAILYSKKQSYSLEAKGGNPEAAVKELMEAQHRDMVKRLKGGALDELVGIGGGPKKQGPGKTAGPEITEFGQGVITTRS